MATIAELKEAIQQKKDSINEILKNAPYTPIARSSTRRVRGHLSRFDSSREQTYTTRRIVGRAATQKQKRVTLVCSAFFIVCSVLLSFLIICLKKRKRIAFRRV